MILKIVPRSYSPLLGKIPLYAVGAVSAIPRKSTSKFSSVCQLIFLSNGVYKLMKIGISVVCFKAFQTMQD